MLSTKQLIEKDILRTGGAKLRQEQRDQMSKILYAYSKRNMEIAYCQGMNYICHFLLEMGFTEEQAFWLLCFIFDKLIDKHYYVNMRPVLADIQLFKQFLMQSNPEAVRASERV